MIIDFNLEEKDLARSMCDVMLKANGVLALKRVNSILNKLQIDKSDYSEEDLDSLKLMCDQYVRATGLASILSIIRFLNKIGSIKTEN